MPSLQQQQFCNGVVTASTTGYLQAISEHAFIIKTSRSAWSALSIQGCVTAPKELASLTVHLHYIW